MKLILLLSIVVICSFIGFSYGEEFLKRTNQLKELLRIVIELENEIIYSHTPLPECLKKIALKTKEPIKKLLEVVEEKLIKNEVLDVYDAFSRGINDEKENLSLKQEHYDIILDLSKSLGETSIDNQHNIFSLAKEKLKREIEETEKESKKNTKAYRSLGLGIGLMIVIFLM